MTIPMNSIEGVCAQPVGLNAAVAQPPLLGDLLRQSAQVGADFEKAVTQFQTAMSEALPKAPVATSEEAPSVAVATPKEVPSVAVATPETLKAEIETNLSIKMPAPLELPPELAEKAEALPKTSVAAVTSEEAPSVAVATPKEAPSVAVATPETLKAEIETNLSIKMPAPLELPPKLVGKAEDADAEVAAPQALPVVEVTLPPRIASVEPAEVATGSVAGVPAVRPVAMTGAKELIAIATSVADAVMVSPGLLQGDGTVRVVLKPDVLQGTEIRVVSENGAVTVNFIPSTPEVAALLERSQPMLVQHLATHVPNVRLGVSVGRGVRNRENA